MDYFIYVIPILGALIGASVVFAGYLLVFASFCEALREKVLDKMVGKIHELILAKADQLDLESEVAPLLDKQLDKLIHVFQDQIPMAALFLSPPLTTKLKDLAKTEIIKMLPELKQKIFHSITQKMDVKELINTNILSKNSALYLQILPYIWKGILAAAAWGFLIGLLQLWIASTF